MSLLGALSWLQLGALCGLISVTALILYGFHPIKRWKLRHIPGPPVRWLVGSIPEIAVKGWHNAVSDILLQYGPVVKVFVGAMPHVITNDPVLARRIARFVGRPPIGIPTMSIGQEKKFEGYQLVFTDGELWRIARNAWQPFFRQDSVAGFGSVFAQSAGKLCAELGEPARSGREVDMLHELGRLTLDVVGSTAFGVDFDTLHAESAEGASKQALPPAAAAAAGGGGGGGSSQVAQPPRVAVPAERLLKAVELAVKHMGPGSLGAGLQFLFPELQVLIRWAGNLYPMGSLAQNLIGRRDLHAVTRQLIHDFKAHAGSEGATEFGSNPEGRLVVNPGSFLALMTRAVERSGLPASDHELWVGGQSFLFTLAGYETTANALAAAVHQVAANPQVEERLLAEIDAFGRDRQPTAGELETHFPFTQGVWKEALRLFPPGAGIGRRSPREGLQLGGYHVPPGITLQVVIYSMHRSKYWRDPEAFLPQRWVPGSPDFVRPDPPAFMPFGDGARKCIGYRFATLEGLLTLIRLYSQYTFRLVPGQVPLKTKMILTLAPAHGVRVTVHDRG